MQLGSIDNFEILLLDIRSRGFSYIQIMQNNKKYTFIG
jgi:hypothetical protein